MTSLGQISTSELAAVRTKTSLQTLVTKIMMNDFRFWEKQIQ